MSLSEAFRISKNPIAYTKVQVIYRVATLRLSAARLDSVAMQGDRCW